MDNFENDYDSLKDVIEFQNHQFNPGHYIGTGKVPPTVSAPGNAMPLAIGYFLAAFIFLGIGLFFFFSDISVTSAGFIESPLGDKILALIIFILISLFFLFFGFVYLKKARKFYKDKKALEREQINETVEDKLWQRTCPDCGKQHDLDFPKCPHCGYDYLNADLKTY